MAPKNKENYTSASKKKRQVSEEEDDEDYRRRRDRNNQAVKRSRVKSKLRNQQTFERVNQLKTENELLEEKVKMLTKELGFLKDLFLAHAGTYCNYSTVFLIFITQTVPIISGSSQHSVNIQDIDLNALLADDTKPEEHVKDVTKP
ncbi:CCAAT/enhancer-binding protein gamma [Anthophora plagiata]